MYVWHIRKNEEDTKYYIYYIEHGCFAENQSLSINQWFFQSDTSMNNCSSSCHLSLILVWKESTRPLNIALNTDHEQTLNNKKTVTSFSSSRFDKTLTDWVQSRNLRNTVECSPHILHQPNFFLIIIQLAHQSLTLK